MKGKTTESSLSVSPYIQDTASLTFYVNYFSSKIDLHTALNKFPIDMGEVCESPGSEWVSPPLDGKWIMIL